MLALWQAKVPTVALWQEKKLPTISSEFHLDAPLRLLASKQGDQMSWPFF
jgi:hypothetical protein